MDTFADHLVNPDSSVMTEFMDSFDPEQQGKIRYDYMARQDEELVQDIIKDKRSTKAPWTMVEVQEEFALLYPGRLKKRQAAGQ